MSELRSEYADKVTFEVESITDEKAAGIAEKHFPDGKHGLLAFGKDGALKDKIEGHSFGKKEIVAIVSGL